jgi:hypothetical protein
MESIDGQEKVVEGSEKSGKESSQGGEKNEKISQG